jgi:hypothetical protein
MRTQTARVLLATAALGAAVAAVPAHAADGGGCQLDGTAAFKNGPGSDQAQKFTYLFSGTLSGCQSNVAGSPASGTIATLVPATGTGGCASNTSAGVAVVTWADKTTTVVSYTTQSATAGVVLQGTVIPSTKAGKKVIKTTRYAGSGAAGLLAFEASPAECASGGVKSAGIAGFVGIGKQ